jgi:hypothetical protein
MSIRDHFIVTLTIIITLLHGNLLAGQIVCPDTADVYIDEWYPDENLNYKDRILVATNTNTHHGIGRGLFLFNVPEELAASEVKKATIYLSACSDCGGGKGGNIAFYALNEPFDEDTDTWNSLGGGNWDDSIYSRAVLPEGSDWNEAVNGEPPADAAGFDVTNLIKNNLERVRNNGMMLRFYDEHQDPYTHQNIASRESDDPRDFAPFLTITTRVDGPCPAEVVFSDSSEKVEVLRQFRNQVLAKSAAGRYIITLYYRSVPFVTSVLTEEPSLKAGARILGDALMP